MVSLIIDLREVDQTLFNKHCQLRFKGLCSSCCDFFKTNKKSVRGHILHVALSQSPKLTATNCMLSYQMLSVA